MKHETMIFEFTMNSQETECALHLIDDANFLQPLKVHYSLAAAMEGLVTDVRNK
jgi:hypothetical protein